MSLKSLKSPISAAVLVAAISTLAPATRVCAQAPPAAPAAPAKPAAPAAPAKPAPPAPPAPPAAPAKPAAPMAVAELTKLFNDAEAAFAAKDYANAVAKIQELLKALGTGKDAPYELLYFNIGLGNLLIGNNAEAATAFKDCVKRFPKGEYATRCYLGMGRASMLQDSPEAKEQAITALRMAAKDSKFRSEAGLWLGQVYMELGKSDEALAVFRSLMGSDVRTPQQTSAAVEVIGLLADTGKIEDLSAYLDLLSHQAGVRDALAWFANQVVVLGDELVGKEAFEIALVIYRSVPPRSQILETQTAALSSMRKDQKILEARVAAERNKPLNQHTNAAELLNTLKPAIELAETAMKAIEEKADLDAALLMRRGRCAFYLERHEEALLCFRTLRTKYENAADGESAAFAEIVILNKRRDIPGIKERCEQFLRKYPNSKNAEQVSTLAGEVLVQSGNWKDVGTFFRSLEKKFPQSESMERYIFFQALAYFQEAEFAESTPLFDKFLKTYPESGLVESALYHVAMSNFLSNKYKETVATCTDYLNKFPNGTYAGDMRYRLSFIDFNDKKPDADEKEAKEYQKKMSEKIIREVGAFLEEHPDDASNGSMLCLMADTYKREDQMSEALEAYKKAVQKSSMDDVIQYALDSATTLMQANKDWPGIAEMHGEFLNKHPDSQMALLSVSWIAKMKAREGKSAEATVMIANALQARIGDPACEQVEFLIDELVKTLVPKKKPSEIDVEAVDKQLVDVLSKITVGKENTTTAARIYYARARLAQMLKRNDRSDLYLKGIATTNAQDPSGLSAALLSVCGDILLKNGDLDGAEAMYKRLCARFKDSMFSDAGPVGMGYVALARKQPEEALRIFTDSLENNPGMSRFKETTLGKLEALVALDKLDDATKLALDTVGDKMFRGEFSGKAYLLLGQVYRKRAAKTAGGEATEFLKQAHGTYQRVYVTSQGFPDVCAEAYWQAFEVAKELGETELANNTLKALSTHPKLKNTKRAKQAAGLVK